MTASNDTTLAFLLIAADIADATTRLADLDLDLADATTRLADATTRLADADRDLAALTSSIIAALADAEQARARARTVLGGFTTP